MNADAEESNPEFPQFAEGPPVPAMCQAELSADNLRRLFRDLTACTEIIAVQEKGTGYSYAAKGLGHLDQALARLLDQGVQSVQIRYRFEAHDWTDTLIRTAHGFRLVRCQHPEA